MITLSPDRQFELVEALTQSFTPDTLERRVLDPMRVPAELRSASRDYRSRVLALTDWATEQQRIGELLQTAYAANRSSERLRLLNQAVGLMPATDGLVEVIRPVLAPGGESTWIRRLHEVEQQVCLVDAHVQASGTGFLVGPDQVMTHAAVVGIDLTKDSARLPPGIQVSFDRNTLSRRTYNVLPVPVFTSQSGVVVLQLDSPAGRDIAFSESPQGGSSGRSRGWLAQPPPSKASSTLAIVQYTEEEELVVSVDVEGLIRTDAEGIHYRTATHAGSMGAPCFDQNWQLVGMHVGSDTKSVNQGIAIATILDLLREKQFIWDLSAGVYRDPTLTESGPAVGDLDALVRHFEIPSDTTDARDDVWAESTSADVSDEDRWAWAEAAAVTAYFDPAKLVAIGAPSEEARVAILLESVPTQSTGGATRWFLPDRIRVRALERLAQRGELQAARARNAADDTETLNVVLGAFIAGTPPTRMDLQSPDRLRAMLQVTGWLARTGIKTLSAVDLRASLERATLIAPFRHLTQGFFAGREVELNMLARYVDSPDQNDTLLMPAPVLIHGLGGMGKSALLAHFILAHSERDTTKPDSWRPFVYLDFDRPDLDARDLPGVLQAIARQLGPQVPGAQPDAESFLNRWSAQQRAARPELNLLKTRQTNLEARRSVIEVDLMLNDLVAVLHTVHNLMKVPIALVVDTLEEVQYATPDAVAPLIQLIVKLRNKMPSLRPVFSGRIEVDPEVALYRVELGPLPQFAAEALLMNHLPAALAANASLVSRMVQTVGGNPLSLRLAAEVLAHETVNNVEQFGDEELWRRVGDAIVQGQLYERIAGHLHEGPVKKLAIPGLILRYVTWELIREVLAAPCGLDVKDDATAQALFTELAKEVALVRQGGDAGKLVLRPQLRRTVLDNFRRDVHSANTRRLIHEAAVSYFEKKTDPESRAEEIYHRLWLDQDPADIDARWINGIDLALRSAVEELVGRARVYLANRVGGVNEEQILTTTSLVEWEAYAEKRASDLLQLGRPAAALDMLHMRSERLPTSRLYLIESVANRSLPDPDLAAAESAATQALKAARIAGDPSEIQSALGEVAQVRRLRQDWAGALEALQELAYLGQQLGDDLVLLGAQVGQLESMGVTKQPVESGEFVAHAVEVFSRLPDELVVRAPELARRAAAQAGATNPTLLQRVVRLVGLGSLNEKTAAGLESVLERWAHRDPEVTPFLPRAPASANELASATQYLFSNHALDPEAAKQFSAWFQEAVTSGHDDRQP
jgi:hypothetical protein